MMPSPHRAAAEIIDALRTGGQISDESILALLRNEVVPIRQKHLADGLHVAGLITEEQRAFVAYLFPQTAGA